MLQPIPLELLNQEMVSSLRMMWLMQVSNIEAQILRMTMIELPDQETY